MNNGFSYKTEKTNKGYTVISLISTPKTGKPMSAKVAPELGSNLFSLAYGSDEIIVYEKSLLEKRGFTGNFVLFPTPNRVRDYTYTWNGKQTLLKKRGKVVEIHGLVFDEKWDFQTPRIQKQFVELTTSITIHATSPLYSAFPFPCVLSLIYRLYKDKLHVQYTVKNTGTEPLPFGFALHPYFNRLSGDKDTYISVPAKSWMEAPPKTLLPTGKLVPVAGKPYDIRKPSPVGSLTLDHVFTDLSPGKFATIDYKKQKIRVTLKTSKEFTHVVVYTGHKKAICIENQTCSTDAHNLWGRGLTDESHLLILQGSKSHAGFIAYEIASY